MTSNWRARVEADRLFTKLGDDIETLLTDDAENRERIAAAIGELESAALEQVDKAYRDGYEDGAEEGYETGSTSAFCWNSLVHDERVRDELDMTPEDINFVLAVARVGASANPEMWELRCASANQLKLLIPGMRGT